jgi:hypothetical protein
MGTLPWIFLHCHLRSHYSTHPNIAHCFPGALAQPRDRAPGRSTPETDASGHLHLPAGACLTIVERQEHRPDMANEASGAAPRSRGAAWGPLREDFAISGFQKGPRSSCRRPFGVRSKAAWHSPRLLFELAAFKRSAFWTVSRSVSPLPLLSVHEPAPGGARRLAERPEQSRSRCGVRSRDCSQRVRKAVSRIE